LAKHARPSLAEHASSNVRAEEQRRCDRPLQNQ
jgi:hypothetical protein